MRDVLSGLSVAVCSDAVQSAADDREPHYSPRPEAALGTPVERQFSLRTLRPQGLQQDASASDRNTVTAAKNVIINWGSKSLGCSGLNFVLGP